MFEEVGDIFVEESDVTFFIDTIEEVGYLTQCDLDNPQV